MKRIESRKELHRLLDEGKTVWSKDKISKVYRDDEHRKGPYVFESAIGVWADSFRAWNSGWYLDEPDDTPLSRKELIAWVWVHGGEIEVQLGSHNNWMPVWYWDYRDAVSRYEWRYIGEDHDGRPFTQAACGVTE